MYTYIRLYYNHDSPLLLGEEISNTRLAAVNAKLMNIVEQWFRSSLSTSSWSCCCYFFELGQSWQCFVKDFSMRNKVGLNYLSSIIIMIDISETPRACYDKIRLDKRIILSNNLVSLNHHRHRQLGSFIKDYPTTEYLGSLLHRFNVKFFGWNYIKVLAKIWLKLHNHIPHDQKSIVQLLKPLITATAVCSFWEAVSTQEISSWASFPWLFDKIILN